MAFASTQGGLVISAQYVGLDQPRDLESPGHLSWVFPRAQVRFKKGVDVSGGAHAWEALATLGSLGPREMPGAGVNPVRHVSQSVPTGKASGGPWDPLPAPREAGMGRKTSDYRREMGTLGTTWLAELLRSKALRTIRLAELL
jgi:hypothetical protein